MGMYVNNSSTWTPPKAIYVKNSGSWASAKNVYINDSGFWYPMFTTYAITASSSNLNLYTALGSPTSPITAVVTINSGVTISGGSSASYALNITGFPSGSLIYLVNNGTIVGKGGNGGARVSGAGGQGASKPGLPGGTAIYTRNTLYIENNGTIAGGGGGGGGGGRTNRGGQAYDDYTGAGGGGAGTNPGAGGTGLDQCGGAPAGTATTGGNGVIYCSNGGSSEQQYGSVGGNGGSLGQPGARGVPNPDYDGTNLGGAAGNAIDGISYTTKLTAGTILGPEVN